MSSKESMLVSKRIKKVRKKMGLTQAQFAELGGVQVLAQTNYERGVRLPQLEYLFALRDSGVDIKYVKYILLGEVVDVNSLSNIEDSLLLAYQKSPEIKKQSIEFVAGIVEVDD